MGLLEPFDLLDEVGPMALHRIRMALGFLVLSVCDRGLGHKRPQACVVRRLGKVAKLLVGNGELLAELAQTSAQLRQAPLDE